MISIRTSLKYYANVSNKKKKKSMEFPSTERIIYNKLNRKLKTIFRPKNRFIT